MSGVKVYDNRETKKEDNLNLPSIYLLVKEHNSMVEVLMSSGLGASTEEKSGY